MHIYKLLFIIDSDFFFITFIVYSILSILTLFIYQALLASLLKIIGSIDGYNIILNSTQSLSISTKIRKYLGNIIVKNIKSTPLFRLRPLKSLKSVIKSYL